MVCIGLSATFLLAQESGDAAGAAKKGGLPDYFDARDLPNDAGGRILLVWSGIPDDPPAPQKVLQDWEAEVRRTQADWRARVRAGMQAEGDVAKATAAERRWLDEISAQMEESLVKAAAAALKQEMEADAAAKEPRVTYEVYRAADPAAAPERRTLLMRVPAGSASNFQAASKRLFGDHPSRPYDHFAVVDVAGSICPKEAAEVARIKETLRKERGAGEALARLETSLENALEKFEETQGLALLLRHTEARILGLEKADVCAAAAEGENEPPGGEPPAPPQGAEQLVQALHELAEALEIGDFSGAGDLLPPPKEKTAAAVYEYALYTTAIRHVLSGAVHRRLWYKYRKMVAGKIKQVLKVKEAMVEAVKERLDKMDETFQKAALRERLLGGVVARLRQEAEKPGGRPDALTKAAETLLEAISKERAKATEESRNKEKLEKELAARKKDYETFAGLSGELERFVLQALQEMRAGDRYGDVLGSVPTTSADAAGERFRTAALKRVAWGAMLRHRLAKLLKRKEPVPPAEVDKAAEDASKDSKEIAEYLKRLKTWRNETKTSGAWLPAAAAPMAGEYRIREGIPALEADAMETAADGGDPPDAELREAAREVREAAERLQAERVAQLAEAEARLDKGLHATYYFWLKVVRGDGEAGNSPGKGGEWVNETAVAAAARPNYFNTNKTNNLVMTLLLSVLVLGFITMARRNPNLFVRKIAGLDAVEEAVGRATEMGKPVFYITGLGQMSTLPVIASINILSRISRKTAQHDVRLRMPCVDPIVMSVAQEVIKESATSVGRPDAYHEEDIFFAAYEQFAYAAAVDGMFVREKPATIFYMGMFYAESLLLAETGASVGAIQIAGTDSYSQLPFFITTCDYTLIGEELYAASAYLSRQPVLLGSLRGQDAGKALIMLALVVGFVLALFGSDLVKLLFTEH